MKDFTNSNGNGNADTLRPTCMDNLQMTAKIFSVVSAVIVGAVVAVIVLFHIVPPVLQFCGAVIEGMSGGIYTFWEDIFRAVAQSAMNIDPTPLLETRITDRDGYWLFGRVFIAVFSTILTIATLLFAICIFAVTFDCIVDLLKKRKISKSH